MPAAYLHLDNASLVAVRSFIDRHNLHDPANGFMVPIKAAARAEGWEIHYARGLGQVYGYALVVGCHRHMWINEDLSLMWQAITIAHEVGHVILKHAGDTDVFVPRVLMSQAKTHTYRQEMEANTVAAMLLIPDRVLTLGKCIDEVARLCHVPYIAAVRRFLGAESDTGDVDDEMLDDVARLRVAQSLREGRYDRDSGSRDTVSGDGLRSGDTYAPGAGLANYGAAS